MGQIRQSRFSANRYWTDILYHNHEDLTPAPITGAKYLWYASLLNTLTIESGVVSQWADAYQGQELFLFFGEDLSKAPTYVSDGFGSQPTLSFNGVNNYLGYGLNENTNEFTIMIVTGDLSENLAIDNGTILIFFLGSTFTLYYANGDAGPAITFAIDGTPQISFPALEKQAMGIRFSNNGGTVEVWQNGGVTFTASIGPFPPPVNYIFIGSSVGANYLDGSISWLSYYGSAISNADLDAAFSQVGSIYGFSTSPVT